MNSNSNSEHLLHFYIIKIAIHPYYNLKGTLRKLVLSFKEIGFKKNA
jgi:hypothetical protein